MSCSLDFFLLEFISSFPPFSSCGMSPPPDSNGQQQYMVSWSAVFELLESVAFSEVALNLRPSCRCAVGTMCASVSKTQFVVLFLSTLLPLGMGYGMATWGGEAPASGTMRADGVRWGRRAPVGWRLCPTGQSTTHGAGGTSEVRRRHRCTQPGSGRSGTGGRTGAGWGYVGSQTRVGRGGTASER